MLQNVGLTGKFFKSLDERNHRFISCYIIAICAEISQKANCFSKAGSIVYSCWLIFNIPLTGDWFEKSVYVLPCLVVAAIVLEADEGEYTHQKRSVIGFGKKNIDELKCGYSSDSEFARHLLSLEWRRRSVSKGALAVTAKFCKTKVEQGVCYTIL